MMTLTELYETMQVLPEWQDRVAGAVRKLLSGACRYQDAYPPWWQSVGLVHLPCWQFIGLVHLMECGCDFQRQILNGEKWNHITTLHPVGRGPWQSWRCSTLDAVNRSLSPPNVWTAEKILHRLERWNGMGYRDMGINSPYLWSGSNHGVGVGKFTHNGYDRHCVSAQVGAALVLREIW